MLDTAPLNGPVFTRTRQRQHASLLAPDWVSGLQLDLPADVPLHCTSPPVNSPGASVTGVTSRDVDQLMTVTPSPLYPLHPPTPPHPPRVGLADLDGYKGSWTCESPALVRTERQTDPTEETLKENRPHC